MLARQRSLNALTTNLPSTMPPTGMISKRMGGSGQKHSIQRDISQHSNNETQLSDWVLERMNRK